MADIEYFCVETGSGTQPSRAPERFPNREAAVDAARAAASQYEDTLTVVKYTRKEIRTFRKKVTIDEADVTA